MSEFLKNTTGQSKFVTVIDSATGGGKTSGVSFTYTAAGGSQGALSGTATHKGNGQYEIVPTQAETNVDCFSIGWYGSGVVPNCVTIFTTTKRLRDLQDLAAGAAMTLTAAYDKAKDDVLTPLAVVDALVDVLISRLTDTRAGYLDAPISSRGTLTASQVRTELATELARIDAAISSRLAAGSYISPSTPSDISSAAAAVLNAIAALNNLSAAQVTTAVPTAASIVTAIKTATGWTRGGTLTLVQYTAALMAALGFKVVDDPDNEGQYLLKDGEDKTTNVARLAISATSPTKEITLL